MKNLIIGIVSGAVLIFLLGWLLGFWSFAGKKDSATYHSSASAAGLSESDIDDIARKVTDKMPDCVKICDKPKSIVRSVKKKVAPKVSCEDSFTYKQCLADIRSDWDFACRNKNDGKEKISTKVSSDDTTLGNTRIENKSVAITINKNDEIDCSKPKEFYINKCKERICHK